MGPSGRATAAADGEGAELPRLVLGWPARHGQHVYYHAADSGDCGGRFVVGRARLLSPREAAISSDEIEDEGYVLTPGGAGAYDAGAGGVSARCVVAHPTDPLYAC